MSKHQFRVLSIDGGGIKGVIACTILSLIHENAGPIHKVFDLVAGTSTGGIIALGLTSINPNTGQYYTPDEMLQLYKNHGNDIFQKRDTDWLSASIGQIKGIPKKALGLNYSETPLENILKRYFEGKHLSDCNPNVLITSYAPSVGQPYYFCSRLARNGNDHNSLITDVARATSAAPTFFNPAKTPLSETTGQYMIDGGVFANNPAVLAYAEAKELWKTQKDARLNAEKGFDAVVSPDDSDLPFFMLSIGTGATSTAVHTSDLEGKRAMHWFGHLMEDIFMRSVAESTHFAMQHLLPPYLDGTKRYERIEFPIPTKCADMDNASSENIDQLIQLTKDYIDQNWTNGDNLKNLIKVLKNR